MNVMFSKSFGATRKACREAVWEKSGGHCWYCGCTLTIDDIDAPNRLCIDHVVSQKNGGGHGLDNLVPACHPCNSAKGRRSIEDFRWTVYAKANGVPYFVPAQRQWLMGRGFVFTGFSNTRFWFEKQGLSFDGRTF